VASRVDDTATVASNDREDYGLVPLEITNGGSLVGAHERAIAGYVGCEDRCQFAGNLWTSRNIRHPGNQFECMRWRLAQPQLSTGLNALQNGTNWHPAGPGARGR